MKKVFLTFLFLSVMVIANNLAANENQSPTSDSAEEIFIYLNTKPTGEISLKAVSLPPIQVWKSANGLEIQFLSYLRNASVKVKNGQGYVMYQTTVNTAFTQSIFISTLWWFSGDYSIEITAGTSTWIGVFEL